MRQLSFQNPRLDATYKTFLGVDYASGTTPTVINNNSFAINDLAVFGEPAEELTELKKINSLSGSTGLVLASALNFSHNKGTPIYKSLWDFIYIEANYGSGFSVISQSGIQWDSKSNETIYYDTNGTDSTSYKFRFYNSVTATYSEYSPTLTGEGFTRKQVGYMIREVRKIVNDLQRKIVSDDEIIRFFNDGQDIVYAHNPKYWFLLVDTYKGSNGIAVTASTIVYSLASYTTYGHLDSLRNRYTSGGIDRLYRLEKKSSIDYDAMTTDLNRGTDDWTAIFKLLPADSSSSNGYIQIDPPPKNSGICTLYPNYYEKMADLNSVDDLTQIPLPRILEQYAIGKIERIKGNEQKAAIYLSGLVSDNEDKVPKDLLLLDKMDMAQKSVQGQPKNLSNYRGQKLSGNLYGNPRLNRDTIKEFYME